MIKSGDIVELHITRLAGLGDGVATHDGQTVFVPFTCAGDVVRAEVARIAKDGIHGNLLEVLTPSPDRATPPCPHFGACGGCELQQLSAPAYGAFKQDSAARVVAQLGAAPQVLQPMFLAGAASRRRAEVKIAVNKGEVALGFHAARSHDVIDTLECKVVEPAIAQAMNAWRNCLQDLKKPSRIQSLQFTVAVNGLDVVVQTQGKLKTADAEMLLAFIDTQPIARLCQIGDNPQIHKAGEADVVFGDATVHLPPSSFLQATQPSQQAMTDLVLRYCAGHLTVADLYCGSGTFALPLAQAGHRVHGYEGNEDAVQALFNAARNHGLEQVLTAIKQDLIVRPVDAENLHGIDAAVINPPRNGALPQCRALAESTVQTVVMVSCNPITFARDAQTLLEGGFFLRELTPVDQFTWSHHLELVGLFSRSAQ